VSTREDDDDGDLHPGAALSRPVQLIRRFILLYGGLAVLLVLFLAVGALPYAAHSHFKAITAELLAGGLGYAALAPILLSLVPLMAAGLQVYARLRRRRMDATRQAGILEPPPFPGLKFVGNLEPGFVSREGQAVILPVGAIIAGLLNWGLSHAGHALPAIPSDAYLVASILIGFALPSLIAERTMNNLLPEQMPEAQGLRRLLLLTTLFLAIGGLGEIGRGLGYPWARWVLVALGLVALAILVELAIRALARMFLPAEPGETAMAATSSILAVVLTGGAAAPGALIRDHLGLDFARSWALSYLSAAALPALIGTILFCWALTGVKLLGPNERGVYERLGAPVAVLGPGLHLLLPWPFGRMRPVELGTIHTIAVGAKEGPNAFDIMSRSERIGAEAVPPASMDRLWGTKHATEAEYLVASQSGGQQGFQAVNAEILVLYRTGLTDADAERAVYGSANQAQVVDEEASRLATRYFSSHTLEDVMGGQREQLQDYLRAKLANAVDADNIGVDIVAFLIDAIHPPAGAAAAYHAVQAAEIKADASVYNAQAHAIRAAGTAQEEANKGLMGARAVAVEKVQGATGDAYRFNAERGAHGESPGAYLLERRIRDLSSSLQGRRLIVVDRRLSADQLPFIDMRGASGSARPVSSGSGSGSAAPPFDLSEGFLPPSTSTEASAPPVTSEQEAEEARAKATSRSTKP